MLDERIGLFILAYESPTFSAAAAKIPMSPQGFTKSIRTLERDLGAPLFATDKRGTRKPTPYADEFYQFAKRQQVEAKKLKASFDRIASQKGILLEVACAVGIPGLFGNDMFTGFSSNDSGVSVSFNELPDSLCDSLVAEGHYDVGISLQPADKRLATQDILISPVLLWVNKENPLYNRNSLTVDDLQDQTIAMPGKGFRCLENLKELCTSRNVSLPNIVEYAEIFWIHSFVAANKGLGFSLPHLASLDSFAQSETIHAIPVEDLVWTVCFTWPGTRDLKPIEIDFMNHVQKRARKVKRMIQ